jgi:uncharacterized membrane protein (DUF2068 family)
MILWLIKKSRFSVWFLNPASPAPVVENSRIFQGSKKFISQNSGSGLFKINRDHLLLWGRVVLAVILFACVLTPKFLLGSVNSAYRVDLRMEDLLLPILLVIALAVQLSSPETKIRETSLAEKAFLLFLLACQLSIFNGMLFRAIDKPLVSLFYLLKWTEYFALFWAVSRLIVKPRDVFFIIKAFFILGLLVACYGYWEYFHQQAISVYPRYYRLFERAPFSGDANHIGGFFILWMGFLMGRYIAVTKKQEQFLILAAFLFALLPFICTYSRKSYVALAVMFLFSFLFRSAPKRLILLACFLVIFACLLPTRLNERLIDFGQAFTTTDPFHSSWAQDVQMWKLSLWNFDHFFLLGSGLGSRHRFFYESLFVLVLSETGLVGSFCFILLCFAPLRKIVTAFYRPLTIEEKGFAWGWLIAFVGLMIQSLSLISLAIVKIAMPFWILTALSLNYLSAPLEVSNAK